MEGERKYKEYFLKLTNTFLCGKARACLTITLTKKTILNWLLVLNTVFGSMVLTNQMSIFENIVYHLILSV